jgi:hypothetical protein
LLLGVTLWGAVSVRRGEVDLDRLDEQAVEVAQAVPTLISEGRAWVTAIYRRLWSEDDPDTLRPLPSPPSVE